MKLDSILYTYKELGTVDKDGVKFKKFVKVPRLRSKHRAVLVQALLVALLVAFLGAGAFKLLGVFVNRSPSEDRPPSQFQGF